MFPHYLPRGEAEQLPVAVADSPCMNESCIDLPYVRLFKGPMFFLRVFVVVVACFSYFVGRAGSTSGGFCPATKSGVEICDRSILNNKYFRYKSFMC